MFCEKKKSKCPKKKKKFFKVWRGKKNVSVEFRVFGKKRKLKERKKKFREKKSKFFFFGEKFFAKFVFTGWVFL